MADQTILDDKFRRFYESSTAIRARESGRVQTRQCPGCGSPMTIQSDDAGTFWVCPANHCGFRDKIA